MIAVAKVMVIMLLSAPGMASGPLRVCPSNPRYFADASGRPVYLTGIHTWNNFKDIGPSAPPAPFDYQKYLDYMVRLNHNFIRLWTWDLTTYQYPQYTPGSEPFHASPFPWLRPGPGLAKDGKPRFDLTKFNTAYFKRLRWRVQEAGKRGIYVSIMLFEGHGTQRSLPPWCWDGHPFNKANNVNGLDGNPNGDERGLEVYTLQVPRITRIQEAYVRRVVDAVNDLDNVLYEICNEAGPYSTDWQYHMIDYLHSYEQRKSKQHPVGMTFQFNGGSNETLFKSPAEWISPNPQGGYRDAPPPADGRKVVINDTDHLWGIGGNVQWVWKSFLRGYNPIFMDPYRNYAFRAGRVVEGKLDPKWDPIRRNLGYTRRFAQRLDLATARPIPDLASTGYCLATPGREYLVYLPEGGRVTVDLTKARGPLAVEWFRPADGSTHKAGTATGGNKSEFTAPFSGDAVLYLKAKSTK